MGAGVEVSVGVFATAAARDELSRAGYLDTEEEEAHRAHRLGEAEMFSVSYMSLGVGLKKINC